MSMEILLLYMHCGEGNNTDPERNASNTVQTDTFLCHDHGDTTSFHEINPLPI